MFQAGKDAIDEAGRFHLAEWLDRWRVNDRFESAANLQWVRGSAATDDDAGRTYPGGWTRQTKALKCRYRDRQHGTLAGQVWQ